MCFFTSWHYIKWCHLIMVQMQVLLKVTNAVLMLFSCFLPLCESLPHCLLVVHLPCPTAQVSLTISYTLPTLWLLELNTCIVNFMVYMRIHFINNNVYGENSLILPRSEVRFVSNCLQKQGLILGVSTSSSFLLFLPL